MIGTMALVVLFVLLVAAVGVYFLRRVDRDRYLAARRLPVEEPDHTPEA